ncbi:MAG: YybH family protein [Acetobacteraceae bacterium]
MLHQRAAVLPLAFLMVAAAVGAAGAQPAYPAPPSYQPPSYALPGVQQQALPPPPPAAPPPTQPPAPEAPAAPTAELPLGASSPQPPAAAQPSQADEAAAIRSAITGWADDFDALKTALICNIFAPNLHYDFGIQPGNYDTLCKRLKAALGQSGVRYNYSPDIQQILISGSLGVASIIWTLKVTQTGKSAPTVITEPAMYVMQREPDGHWSVIRFLAFNVPNPSSGQ